MIKNMILHFKTFKFLHRTSASGALNQNLKNLFSYRWIGTFKDVIIILYVFNSIKMVSYERKDIYHGEKKV